MITNYKLKPTYLLLELPSETEEDLTKMKSGLYLMKREKDKYVPTHGKVIKSTSETVFIDDEVFFGNHVWGAAKFTAFGDPERPGVPLPSAYFAIKEGDKYYLLIPDNRLYFLKRGETIIVLNNHVIAEPIKREQKIYSGIIIVDLQPEDYINNKYRVFLAPEESGLHKGDVIDTLNHCDIEVENPLNNPILPNRFFFIELDDILAKEDNGKLIPLAL